MIKAFQIRDASGDAAITEIDNKHIGDGEVEIDVEWSCVNYKDALAGTGKGKILRKFPLIGGVDLAGTVSASSDSRIRTGDAVITTGYGLSQTHDGGYSTFARVPADWVVPVPDGWDARSAMLIGTAGFTAGLSLYRMQQLGQAPSLGPILITGASGGVSCVAIRLFSAAGYEVIGLSRKRERDDWLKSLGCTQVMDPADVVQGTRALESAQWGGALDSVGGETLAWLTRTVKPWGNIASFGLAGGHELHTTVMPFILRGINLLGINSADTPMEIRREVWQLLAKHLTPTDLEPLLHKTISLDELADFFPQMLAGNIWGRTLVKVQ